MTSLILHTPATSVNTMLSMPSISSLDKAINAGKSFISYTAESKSLCKTSSTLSSFDWDLNQNELEFE